MGRIKLALEHSTPALVQGEPEFSPAGALKSRGRTIGIPVKIFLFILLLSLWMAPAHGRSEHPASVVAPQWLKANIGTPRMRVIELSDETSFEFDGHIPGAVFISKEDLRYQADDGALVHHAPEKLQDIIRRMGINDGDHVIIYYKGKNLNEILGSFYLFWLFHYLGHTDVAMLDQGWHGWLAAKGPVTFEAGKIEPGNFHARPLAALEINTSELFAIHDKYTVIDGRPAGHFAGRTKFPGNTRYGRIAGSLSQPWEDYLNQDENGLIFLDLSDLPKLLKHGMITKGQPLLHTCFGGTGAAINYAYFYIHGYHNQRMHDAGLRRWNARNLPLTRDSK